MKTISFLLLLSLALIGTLAGCGPSREEIEYYESHFTQEQCDSIWIQNGNTSSCPFVSKVQAKEVEEESEGGKVTSPSAEEYFLAAEYNLVPGEVYAFTMDNESAREAFDNGRPTVYIQIKVAGGQIRSFACDERTWYNLTPGNILR